MLGNSSVLTFFSVVNHGANFCAEFFLHAADDWILFGAAAASRTGSQSRRAVALFSWRSHIRPREDFQFRWTAEDSAGSGDASRLASALERHVDDGLRLGDLDDDFVALTLHFHRKAWRRGCAGCCRRGPGARLSEVFRVSGAGAAAAAADCVSACSCIAVLRLRLEGPARVSAAASAGMELATSLRADQAGSKTGSEIGAGIGACAGAAEPMITGSLWLGCGNDSGTRL